MTNAPDLSRSDNRLLAALPRETLALFGQDLKQVSLSQAAVCYEAGDRIDRVYFPISGMISLLIAGRNGDMVETGIVGREGAAGLHSGLGERRSFNRATIQIPGQFAVISAAHFGRAVSNSPPLRDLVFRYVESRWVEAQQIAACNALHSGTARLCRWLLQAADCTGSDHIPLTQEYLADMLGVRRTTVTLFFVGGPSKLRADLGCRRAAVGRFRQAQSLCGYDQKAVRWPTEAEDDDPARL